MKRNMNVKLSVVGAALALAWASPGEARVSKIVIDRTETPLCVQRNQAGVCTATDPLYEGVTGRAFGELDPHDHQNSEITDLKKAKRNSRGKVEYVATFFIVKPIDMASTSGLMWHDVPNRGGRITISADLRAQGDIGLSSAWQGDNAGNGPGQATVVPPDAWSATPVTPTNNEWVATPVIQGVTGKILGRIINRSGLDAQPLNVMGNPIPYFPVGTFNPANKGFPSNAGASLTTILHETIDA
jgi:hypothetical protein